MTDILIKDVPDDSWEIFRNNIPRSFKINDYMINWIVEEAKKIKEKKEDE